MIHPDTEVREAHSGIGLGVFATAAIPRGTIVWAQDALDRVFTSADLDTFPANVRALIDRYGYRDASGRYILCWDAGRLVNHSCNPSIRGLGPNVMIAVRDLAPGEEITCDYAECNLVEPLDCHCDTARCRGQICGDDLIRLGNQWDALVADVACNATRVEQPVVPFVLDRRALEDMLSGARPIPPFCQQCAGSPRSIE